MAANRKVSKLLDQKKQIDRELTSIRDTCMHLNQSIKQVYTREGSQGDIRWVCSECEGVQGYPTKLELENFLNNKK